MCEYSFLIECSEITSMPQAKWVWENFAPIELFWKQFDDDDATRITFI